MTPARSRMGTDIANLRARQLDADCYWMRQRCQHFSGFSKLAGTVNGYYRSMAPPQRPRHSPDSAAPAAPTFAQHQAAPAAFRQPGVVAGSYADSQTGDAMNKRRKRFPINREAYDLLMAGISNSEGTPPERMPSSALRRCAIVAIRPPPAGCRWLAVVAIPDAAAPRTGPRSRRRRPASRSQDRTRNAPRPVPPP